jgi:CheY-like chemotaxis protein
VDSAADEREMYAEFLGGARFRTIGADNTEDAMRLAPLADVIVTELRVRGPFDGGELARRLRADERTRRTPVIALTASVYPADRQFAIDCGCTAFVAKPCAPETLVAEIRRVLALRAVDRPRAAPADGRSRREKTKRA